MDVVYAYLIDLDVYFLYVKGIITSNMHTFLKGSECQKRAVDKKQHLFLFELNFIYLFILKQYPRFPRILWDIWLFMNVTGKYYLRSFVLNGLQSSSFVTHILFCMLWHFNITGQRSTMRNKALTRSLWEKEKIIYGVCIFKSSELNTNECFVNAVFQTFIRMTQIL